jgi:alkylation response protein AidB-like acyl-CoA dehydrogenase
MSRIGARGYGDGMLGGMVRSFHLLHTISAHTFPQVIGLPPVLNFGSDELKAGIVPDIFAGKKFICLAVSEAYVLSIRTGAIILMTK